MSSEATAKASSAKAPYVFLFVLLEIMLESLLLAISLDMLFSSYLLDCMTSLFSTLMTMFYVAFYGCERLIYSTHSTYKS
jgi:hypothetical protein